MKTFKSILLIFVFILPNYFFSDAQPNLVLNPSLENYITCPGFGQFSNTYINNWTKPSYGSTDYYNDSCTGIHCTQQIPRSGIAYAGIICYNYGTEYREYMTGQLSSTLITGMTYSVEFYISLNDGYIQAIQEVGAYLSNSVPGPYSNALHVPAVPQVENMAGILSDTSAWMLVSGTFVASGGEEYITIGNFHNDTTTTIVQVGNIGSFGTYYFVDDVSVKQIDPTASVSEESENKIVSVFPNPSIGKIFFKERNNSLAKVSSLKLIDIFGRELNVFFAEKIINDFSFDIAGGKGIYFLEIEMKNGEKVIEKVIVD